MKLKELLIESNSNCQKKLCFETKEKDKEYFMWSDDMFEAIKKALANDADKITIIFPDGNEFEFNVKELLDKEMEEDDILDVIINEYSKNCRKRNKSPLVVTANSCDECEDELNEMPVDELIEKAIDNCSLYINVECETVKGYSRKYDEYDTDTVCSFEINIVDYLTKDEIIKYWKERIKKGK